VLAGGEDQRAGTHQFLGGEELSDREARADRYFEQDLKGAESKTLLGFRVHQVGAVYDLIDDMIIGRLAEGSRGRR
jgi:hypothetical protein